MGKIVSTILRNSARGEDCTLQIAGSCNGNSETTVFCHFPDGSGGGMGTKPTDLSGGYGCDACHAVIDRRYSTPELTEDEREFYMRRSMIRTQHRLVDKGILLVRGAK